MVGSWVWSYQLSVGFLRWWNKRKGTAIQVDDAQAKEFTSVQAPPAKFE